MNRKQSVPFALAACGLLIAACGSSATSASTAAGTPAAGSTADWSCVSAVQTASASRMSPQLTVHATDAILSRALPGLTVRTCAALPCAKPLAEAVTDMDGLAMLSPTGAVVTIDGESTFESVPSGRPIPTNVFYVAQGQTSLEADVLDSIGVVVAAQLAGARLLAGRGIVEARILDCGGALAPGVTLSIAGSDASTIVRYVTGNQAAATGSQATDSSGAGTVFDVPAGAFRVDATDLASGAIEASQEGYVPSQGVTHIDIRPVR